MTYNDDSITILQNESECVCTPFNLCKTYKSAPDGEELIDIRSPFGVCDSYMDVCCNDTISSSTEVINQNIPNTDTSCICAGQEENKPNTEQPLDEYSPTTPIQFFTSKEKNKPSYQNRPAEHISSPSPLDQIHSTSTEDDIHENKNKPDYQNRPVEHISSPSPLDQIHITSTEEDIYNLQNPTYKPTDHLISSENKPTEKPHKIVSSVENENFITTEATGSKTKDQHKCGSWNKNGLGFRIVNAIDGESQYGEFPSMIAILKEEVLKNGEKNLVYHCGGSLIEKNVVLTATHCVINKDPSTLIIRAGEWDLQTDKEIYPHQDRHVKKIVSHPKYYAGGLHNDISLIFTDEPFILHDHVNTICLPEKNEVFTDKKCFSSGWGTKVYYNNYTIVKKTESGKLNKKIGQYQVNILKKVDLKIMESEKCMEILRTTRLGPKFILHDSFTCAGGEEGKDTCKGDGGSPLMCQYGDDSSNLVQVGIVAWGINCGLAGIPAVYVDVAHFSQWIHDEISNYT
uniref:Phenoloxidase-activating factor 2 n=1 Tax=Sipha flava TaxID=143950 RepID=A0A2S2R9K9_9HEMI